MICDPSGRLEIAINGCASELQDCLIFLRPPQKTSRQPTCPCKRSKGRVACNRSHLSRLAPRRAVVSTSGQATANQERRLGKIGVSCRPGPFPTPSPNPWMTSIVPRCRVVVTDTAPLPKPPVSSTWRTLRLAPRSSSQVPPQNGQTETVAS